MIGWIGSILFAFAGFPQAFQCMRDGHARGLSWAFLLLWFGGEVCTLYAVIQDAPLGYLLLNYTANLVSLLIILRYRAFPRVRGLRK